MASRGRGRRRNDKAAANTGFVVFLSSSVASDNFSGEGAPTGMVLDGAGPSRLEAGARSVVFWRGGHMGLYWRYPVFWPRPGYCVSTGTQAGALMEQTLVQNF